MSFRSIGETIENLRILLHKFEHSPEADYDEFALAELKRIILNRIAELETEWAMNEEPTPVTPHPWNFLRT
jgi:hypothetical protein